MQSTRGNGGAATVYTFVYLEAHMQIEKGGSTGAALDEFDVWVRAILRYEA